MYEFPRSAIDLPALIERTERHYGWRTAHPEIDYRPLAELVAEQANTLRAHRIDGGCAVFVDDTCCCTRVCSILALWSIGAQVVVAPGIEPTAALRWSSARYRLSFGVCGQPHLFGTEVMVRPTYAGPSARRPDPLVRIESDGRARGISPVEIQHFFERHFPALPAWDVATPDMTVLSKELSPTPIGVS